MKTQLKSILLLLCWIGFSALPAQSDYFFPKGNTFNPDIPSPEQFLGYPIGDFHTRIDRMVAYMEALAAASERAHFEVIGYTNEMRPQVVLTVTDPQNYDRLEAIRQEHLKFTRPEMPSPDPGTEPVIVLLGYNVHGNEPSSTEAAMLTAYYLVASESAEVRNYLSNAVIFIDPAFNPDGRDRHSHWANMHKASQLVEDTYDREHNEVWPGGRTNHYWFDLNRDWLPLAQVESRNRLEFYRRWLPNVVTDYHEMGTNSTYFFEPTKPFGSENPIVPRSNYDGLNNLFAPYFRDALDEMGSLYFTKEVYDNSYPGYGSTYPDIHGGLGMVFEQASSRGHVQESSTEDVTFAFTIRNHVRTSLATVRASVENRRTLLDHQRNFFEAALEKGRKAATKGYVFGTSGDWNRTRAFATLLLDHGIETYQLNEDLSLNGKRFEQGKAFVVPAAQAQYLMVQTMFEPVTTFYDSVFYDASSWTMALAFGMPYEKSSRELAVGAALQPEDLAPAEKTIAHAGYAYLFHWTDYLAPKALYFLLKNGVHAKTAYKPFTANVNGKREDFGYGSILISVADQAVGVERLHELITQAANLANIDIHAVNSGFSINGPDLGSRSFETVELPRVAMVIGNGSSAYEAGEIWHLLDTRYDMPIVKIDLNQLDRAQLDRYNTLVLVSLSGNPFSESQIARIKDWTAAGNTLILQRGAVNWAIRNKLINETFVENKTSEAPGARYDFATRSERQGAKSVGGVVFKADIDISHPLGFGFTDRSIHVYRNHNYMIQPSKNPYQTVVQYANEAQVDGYVHPEPLAQIKGSASVIAGTIGAGNVVCLVDNPNFRGFWYGTNRLFINGLFIY